MPLIRSAASFPAESNHKPTESPTVLKFCFYHHWSKSSFRTQLTWIALKTSLLSTTYHCSLKDFFIHLVKLKGLLVVQVCGSQGNGQVDSSNIRKDGIFSQSLQGHTGVLGARRGRNQNSEGCRSTANFQTAPAGTISLINSYSKRNIRFCSLFLSKAPVKTNSGFLLLPVWGGSSKELWKVFLLTGTQIISVRKMGTPHSWINHPRYLFQRFPPE